MIAALFGAFIGSMFLGFPGILIGAVAAIWLKQMLTMTLMKGRLNNIRNQYIEATYAVMGAVCKADGSITQDEIKVAERMFDNMRMDAEQRRRARQAFRRGKSRQFNLDATVAQVRKLCRGQRAMIQIFLQVQLEAIMADGALHPKEREIIMRVAHGLGLSNLEIRQIEALLNTQMGGEQDSTGQQQRGRYQTRGPSQSELDRAYAVLGVNKNASDGEVKKAYRTLMHRNHPDKLAGRGLPESMLAMAAEKTKEISAAYDRIKRTRPAL